MFQPPRSLLRRSLLGHSVRDDADSDDRRLFRNSVRPRLESAAAKPPPWPQARTRARTSRARRGGRRREGGSVLGGKASKMMPCSLLPPSSLDRLTAAPGRGPRAAAKDRRTDSSAEEDGSGGIPYEYRGVLRLAP